jgi:hypothetical protein
VPGGRGSASALAVRLLPARARAVDRVGPWRRERARAGRAGAVGAGLAAALVAGLALAILGAPRLQPPALGQDRALAVRACRRLSAKGPVVVASSPPTRQAARDVAVEHGLDELVLAHDQLARVERTLAAPARYGYRAVLFYPTASRNAHRSTSAWCCSGRCALGALTARSSRPEKGRIDKGGFGGFSPQPSNNPLLLTPCAQGLRTQVRTSCARRGAHILRTKVTSSTFSRRRLCAHGLRTKGRG